MALTYRFIWHRLTPENYYSRVPEVYDVPTMIRASLVHYHTLEEFHVLLKALNEIGKSY